VQQVKDKLEQINDVINHIIWSVLFEDINSFRQFLNFLLN